MQKSTEYLFSEYSHIKFSSELNNSITELYKKINVLMSLVFSHHPEEEVTVFGKSIILFYFIINITN